MSCSARPQPAIAAAAAQSHSQELVRLAERHGISALLAQALGEAPGLAPELIGQLRAHARTIAVTNLALTAEFARIAAAFDAAGIPVMAYKGPIFAERVYKSVGLRRSGDLDFLIQPRDTEAALAELRNLGYKLPFGFSDRQRRRYERVEAGYECMHPRGFVADLQFRIVPRHFCVELENDVLFARSRLVPYSGGEVRALSAEDELLALALHGSKHCWERLIWLCDVGRLIAAEADLDWDLVLHRAGQLHVQRIVLMAVLLASDYLGARVPAVVLASCRQERAIQRVAAEVIRGWQSGNGTSAPKRWSFVLRMRERERDRWLCALRYLTSPTVADWEIVDLPAALSILYPAVRGVRVLSQLARATVAGSPSENAPDTLHAN
jgi:hypothetical protein